MVGNLHRKKFEGQYNYTIFGERWVNQGQAAWMR